MKLKTLTPVLVVDDVQAGLDFWTTRLGFEIEHKVPATDGTLQFGSCHKGPIEIMYQSHISAIADIPALEPDLNGHSVTLFFVVADVAECERAMEGVPFVKERHKTFYGSEEFYVREPGGTVVGFAQMG